MSRSKQATAIKSVPTTTRGKVLKDVGTEGGDEFGHLREAEEALMNNLFVLKIPADMIGIAKVYTRVFGMTELGCVH